MRRKGKKTPLNEEIAPKLSLGHMTHGRHHRLVKKWRVERGRNESVPRGGEGTRGSGGITGCERKTRKGKNQGAKGKESRILTKRKTYSLLSKKPETEGQIRGRERQGSLSPTSKKLKNC